MSPTADEPFRAEVRAFLVAAMSDAAAHADPTDVTGLDEPFERALHRAAGARGWLGLPPERQAIFNFEVAYADAPLIDTGMTLVGGLVHHYRPELLPRFSAGEATACIAYTEPNAGSDLSAIEAVAETDGDGWVLRGTKVLVTGAPKADWCCTIARTRLEGEPRRGMSMFLFPLPRAGIEIVRRRTMNGWDLSDVHFHDVRLDAHDLLGDRDAGWRQLVTALAAERSGMFWLGFARRVLDLLIGRVRESMPADVFARDMVARLAVEWAAAERLCRRTLESIIEERDEPALPSMAKVVTTELLQDLAQSATELLGTEGLRWSPLFGDDAGRFGYEYLERVHGTIGAGANEVQRDTIAQRGLGLPRAR